jgi:hypothetical protein
MGKARMSDPVSKDEFEDVVSSVRRLVAPDARPRPMSRDLGLDKLILTSSLRIVAEQQAAGQTVVKLEAVPKAPRAPVRVTASQKPQRRVPGAGGAVDPSLPGGDDELDEQFWTEPQPSLSEMALGAEEAEVVAEKVPVAPPHLVSASKAALPETPVAEPASDPAEPAPPADAGPAEAKDDGARKRPAAAKAKSGAAASGAKTRRGPGKVAKPDAAARGLGELTGTVAEGLTDRDGNPISLLDEEQLIQLLRRVIREELQGALGEKITRNVRKLVRAEIALALTSETLE